MVMVERETEMRDSVWVAKELMPLTESVLMAAPMAVRSAVAESWMGPALALAGFPDGPAGALDAADRGGAEKGVGRVARTLMVAAMETSDEAKVSAGKPHADTMRFISVHVG
jgi:hypothetical protein